MAIRQNVRLTLLYRLSLLLIPLLYLAGCVVEPLQDTSISQKIEPTVDVPPLTIGWVKSDSERNSFGYSVAGAGDVNGDGFDDALVGWKGIGWGGQVDVYTGGPDGPSKTPFLTFEGAEHDTSLGYTVSPAGDIDGDGIAEIVIEEATFNEGRGRVSLYKATDAQNPVWVVEGGDESANLGASVDSAGDVNGDGYDDLLVGAPGMLAGAGQAMLYFGDPVGLADEPDWLIEGDFETNNVKLGSHVVGIGDINADGYADIAVAGEDHSKNPTGKSLLFVDIMLGSVDGPQMPGQRMSSELDGYGILLPLFGKSGDINGDGYDDFAVSSEINEEKGSLLVYFGSKNGLAEKPSQEISNDDDSKWFGSPVIGVGDINVDGFDDLAFGYIATEADSEYELYKWRTELYLGSMAGINHKSNFSFPSQELYHQYSYAIDAAGDVDGNGIGDVVVGNPNFLNERGRVYLFLGGDATEENHQQGMDAPADVVEAIFRVADTLDFSELTMLCDPFGQNDWDTQYVCDFGHDPFLGDWFGYDGYDPFLGDWFSDRYKAGEIVGGVTIDPDGESAHLFIEYPNAYGYLFGDQADVTLIHRPSGWYLYDMDVSEKEIDYSELLEESGAD